MTEATFTEWHSDFRDKYHRRLMWAGWSESVIVRFEEIVTLSPSAIIDLIMMREEVAVLVLQDRIAEALHAAL